MSQTTGRGETAGTSQTTGTSTGGAAAAATSASTSITSATTTPANPPRRAIFIAATSTFACAVLADNSVHCWGGGGFSRDIFGDTMANARRPVEVPELRGSATIAIAMHDQQLCGLSPSGAIRCKHRLGTFPSQPVLNDATAMALGDYHGCAVTKTGRVMCWGKTYRGALGNGSTAAVAFAAKPTAVAGLNGITGVTAGYERTCAWDNQGGSWCWGRRQAAGGTQDTATPAPVAHLAGALRLVSSKHQDCALRRDGQIRCSSGARRLRLRSSSGRPLDGTGMRDAVDVAVGNHLACAASKRGQVFCWGNGKHGRLGDGRAWNKRHERRSRYKGPTTVPNVKNIIDVETSGLHTCGRSQSGEVWCWGRNGEGELGNGKPSHQPHRPVKVSGIDDARQLALGNDFSCALRSDGSVWCWGKNSWGQTGSGRDSKREPTPVRVLLR